MKVKNSKYTLLLAAMMVSSTLFAQLDAQGFSPVKRDTEVTRITFENYLKKWTGEIMLNRFKETKAEYKNGEGMTIRVLAENAQIFMSVQGGQFENADGEMMDLFFSDEMIGLQKDRLRKAVQKFVVDFKQYLPELNDSEQIRFVFEVKDRVRKEKGKELPPSKLAHKRTYHLEALISYADFKAFKEGDLNEEDFKKKVNINLKQSVFFSKLMAY